MRTFNTVVAALALAVIGPHAAADTTSHDAFTYQGVLRQSGAPVTGSVNFTFRLYDAAVSGNQVGPELEALNFNAFDEEGRFTIDLAFGKDVFDGTPLWLEARVNGAPLSPRQAVMPTPYAVRALTVATVADGALSGAYTNALSMTNANNQFAGSGAGLSDLSASNITTGTLGSAHLGGTYSNALTLTNAANAFTGTFSGTHAGSGAALTNLDAGNISSGLLPNARLGGTYSSVLVFSSPNNVYNGSGASLVNLNASNISSGTLSPARLPSGGAWPLSSTLDIGSAALAIDPSGDRIGLGTTSPSHRLELAPHSSPNGGIAFGTDVQLFRSANNMLSLGTGDSLNISGGSYSVAGQTVISLSRTFLAADGNTTVPAYGFSSGTSAGVGMYKPASDNLAFATSGDERIRINQAGNVGIGTALPAFLLHVNGSAGKPGGGSWSVASDARLKTNIQDLDGALESLLALRGVTFEYTNPAAIFERPGLQIGMIAQEVEGVFPQWVENGPDGYKRLTITGFEALAVEALRELREQMQAEVSALQHENEQLRERLAVLERAMQRN